MCNAYDCLFAITIEGSFFSINDLITCVFPVPGSDCMRTLLYIFPLIYLPGWSTFLSIVSNLNLLFMYLLSITKSAVFSDKGKKLHLPFITWFIILLFCLKILQI